MSERAEDGFILIAVLWMLAALAALAGAYSVYATETAASVASPGDRLRAEAAIRAGVELCAYEELSWPRAARPHAGAFSTLVGDSRVDVAFRSENGRIDINAASREVLAGLFGELGAGHSGASYLADRIVAWRSKLKNQDRMREAAIYAKAGLSYPPLGAPFDNVLELALLPGMTPELLKRALPHLTIFGAGDHIDPLAADPIVLAALPGATASVVNALLAAQNRPAPDAASLSAMAGPLKDLVDASASDVVRARIVARLNDRRVSAEMVMKLTESEPSPYEILYWRDDFDDGGTGE
jgi:general secretion pathway protein K